MSKISQDINYPTALFPKSFRKSMADDILEEKKLSKRKEKEIKDYLKSLDWQTWIEIEQEVNKSQFPEVYDKTQKTRNT